MRTAECRVQSSAVQVAPAAVAVLQYSPVHHRLRVDRPKKIDLKFTPLRFQLPFCDFLFPVSVQLTFLLFQLPLQFALRVPIEPGTWVRLIGPQGGIREHLPHTRPILPTSLRQDLLPTYGSV